MQTILTPVRQLVSSFADVTRRVTSDCLSRVVRVWVVILSLMDRARCKVLPNGLSQIEIYSETGALGKVLAKLGMNARLHPFDGVKHRGLTLKVCSIEGARLGVDIVVDDSHWHGLAAVNASVPFLTPRVEWFFWRRTVEQMLGEGILFLTQRGRGQASQDD